MVTKILKTASKETYVYDNKGSASTLVNYLAHEADTKDQAIFFNATQVGIEGQSVVERLDNNTKGLQKNEAKFVSLVIAPSKEELAHLQNNDEKLRAYTAQVMQNYAQNFNLNTGKKLSEQDMVWFATIHQSRTYKGNDTEVKEGKKKSGEKKEGLQTHIHVIVSYRDKSQSITLNPSLSKKRFSWPTWDSKNRKDFQAMFHYSPVIDKDVERKKLIHSSQKLINKGFDPTLMEKLTKLGEEKGFSKGFKKEWHTIQQELHKNPRTPVPEDYLQRLEASKGLTKAERQRTELHQNLTAFTRKHDIDTSDFDVNQVLKIAEKKEYSEDFQRGLRMMQAGIIKDPNRAIPADYLAHLEALNNKGIAERIEKTWEHLRAFVEKNHIETHSFDVEKVIEIGQKKGFSRDFLQELKHIKTDWQQQPQDPPLDYLARLENKQDRNKEAFIENLRYFQTKHGLSNDNLDIQKIADIAQEKGYSQDFQRTLRAIQTQEWVEGKRVIPADYLQSLGETKSRETEEAIRVKEQADKLTTVLQYYASKNGLNQQAFDIEAIVNTGKEKGFSQDFTSELKSIRNDIESSTQEMPLDYLARLAATRDRNTEEMAYENRRQESRQVPPLEEEPRDTYLEKVQNFISTLGAMMDTKEPLPETPEERKPQARKKHKYKHHTHAYNHTHNPSPEME